MLYILELNKDFMFMLRQYFTLLISVTGVLHSIHLFSILSLKILTLLESPVFVWVDVEISDSCKLPTSSFLCLIIVALYIVHGQLVLYIIRTYFTVSPHTLLFALYTHLLYLGFY